MIDLDPTLDFIASHARLLDRRRLELALGGGDPEATLAVLAGYRNPDGGFGWGLEPDLRARRRASRSRRCTRSRCSRRWRR